MSAIQHLKQAGMHNKNNLELTLKWQLSGLNNQQENHWISSPRDTEKDTHGQLEWWIALNVFSFNFGCTGSLLGCKGFLEKVAQGGFSLWGMDLRALGSIITACRFSCPMACSILVPQPGIELTSLTLEGGLSTLGPPGKS